MMRRNELMGRTSGRWMVVFFALFVAAAGCSEGPETDSETHWVEACEVDADCEGDLGCKCNFCTTTCEDECVTSADGIICVEAPEACQLGAQTICAQECNEDGDCDDDRVCEEGSCVPGEVVEQTNQQNDPSNDNDDLNVEEQDEIDGVDMLWTIDNSGAMCRSQHVLRDAVDEFVESLQQTDLDFHLGVTTTHMIGCDDMPGCERDDDDQVFCDPGILAESDADPPGGDPACHPRHFDPVSRPMQLQATPQPLPGFNEACFYDLYSTEHPDVGPDDSTPTIGDPNPESIGPVERNIETAVDCTENPADYQDLLDFDEERLRCALTPPLVCNLDDRRIDEESDYCLCPADDDHPFDDCIDCEQFDGPQIEEFFPDPQDYRDLDPVLRTEEYRDDDGELLVDELRDDFACMSLVGTRGDGFTRGLDAAVGAISQEMTGGTEYSDWQDAVDARNEHPNAGFLRSDAAMAAMFVTTRNDCSHDGMLEENTLCGFHNCIINDTRDDGGHLKSTESLSDAFMEELAASRGEEGLVDPDFVLPVSIHGRHRPLTSEETPDQCPQDQRWEEPPSCYTEMGQGWSGHRYEAFLREFPRQYPPAEDEEPLPGEICSDFSLLMGEITSFIDESVDAE